MKLCSAIGVCFMENDPSCPMECATDLYDCTPDQVATLDACSTQACGDENNSPIINCIMGVACVDQALRQRDPSQ